MIFHRVKESVKRDYARACGFKGYVANRLKEKTTWGSLVASITAANELKPLFAGATIAISTVVALLPSSALNKPSDDN